MINRDAKDVLLRLTNQFPVVCVTGPRQCGKTTLAKMVFPDKKYVSLDDRDTLNMAINDPNDFINAFPSGAIIDEAQKAPDIFNALKLDADSNNTFPGKFIITGSSQFHLRKNMTDSLAGRAAFLQLLPFSVSELKQAKILPNDPYDLNNIDNQ